MQTALIIGLVCFFFLSLILYFLCRRLLHTLSATTRALNTFKNDLHAFRLLVEVAGPKAN
jgi:hypothetical protein